VAGVLQEIFVAEMTAAEGTCSGCGSVRAVGSLEVYANAPGVVIRCPGCKQVLMRVVRGPDRVWLDLSGTRCLELALPVGEGSTVGSNTLEDGDG